MKMTISSFFILLLLLGISCTPKKSNHTLNLYKGKSYFTGFNAKLLKEDSLKLEQLCSHRVWSRMDFDFVKNMVFAKSSVQMVEVNKHRSDFEVYDFHYCEATKTDTGLVIRLKQDAPFDRVMRFAGVNVEFTLLGEDFKSRIIHWSDIGPGILENKVFYDNLTIWGNTLEKGDTISGRIHLIAIAQKDKRQIYKGNFNAIIR
jgi:hypothetical protein